MSAPDPKKTRFTLIQRLKDQQDEQAWNEFYQFYWDLITGWARKYGCSHTLAQDVFQETMVCLLRNLPNFEYDPNKGCFRAYLKTIVLRRVRDAFRREGKYISATATESADEDDNRDIFSSIADDSADFEPEMDAAWLRGILTQALRNTYRKIDTLTYKSFCLYVLDGLPVEEVGKRLDISRTGTIYQQKSRFLGMLKTEFSRLLEDLDNDRLDSDLVKDNLFTKAFEELVKERPDYRETMIRNTLPERLYNQLEFIRTETGNLDEPGKPGKYLLLKDSRDKSASKWVPVAGEVSIGRKEDCVLPLNSEDVSTLHASLSQDAGKFVIRDENSANGVYVNGKKIDNRHELCPGDIIQLGSNYSLIFFDQ